MSSIDYIRQREQIVVDAWEAFLELRKQYDLPGEFQDLFIALKEVAMAGIENTEALEEAILDRKLSDRRKQPDKEAAIYAVMAEILVTRFNVILIDYSDPSLPRGFWDPVLDLLSERGIIISHQALTKFMEFRSDRWHKVNHEMVTKWMPVWFRQQV
jgi:hypothetical protein